ncbi:MAG: hypothetical protein ACLRPW_02485 [Intestinibacter sp.]
MTFAVGMAGDEVFSHFGVDDSKGISYKNGLAILITSEMTYIFDGIIPH